MPPEMDLLDSLLVATQTPSPREAIHETVCQNSDPRSAPLKSPDPTLLSDCEVTASGSPYLCSDGEQPTDREEIEAFRVFRTTPDLMLTDDETDSDGDGASLGYVSQRKEKSKRSNHDKVVPEAVISQAEKENVASTTNAPTVGGHQCAAKLTKAHAKKSRQKAPSGPRRRNTQGYIVQELYIACSRARVTPVFEYFEEKQHKTSNFKAKVRIGDETFDLPRAKASQKLAKSALCELVLDLKPKCLKQDASEKPKEWYNKAQPTKPGQRSWSNCLRDIVAQNNYAEPQYIKYVSDTHWKVYRYTVKLPGVHENPFISEAFAHAQHSKDAVAREAYFFLCQKLATKRREDAIAKRKAGPTTAAPEAKKSKLAETEVKQTLSADKETSAVANDASNASKDNGTDTSTITTEPSSEIASQARLALREVGDAAASLGFLEPLVQVTQRYGDFVSVAAFFDRWDAAQEPLVQGPVGEVHDIAGELPAKLKCCQLVLEVLDMVEERKGRLRKHEFRPHIGQFDDSTGPRRSLWYRERSEL